MICWQITALHLNDEVLLPSPSAVFEVLQHPFTPLMGSSSWCYHLTVSFLRVLFGFTLAALLAIPAGVLLGRFSPLEKLGSGTLAFLQPLSPIMWIPFTMILFKGTSIGDLMGVRRYASIFNDLPLGMIFVIFYGAFFPIFINAINAVKGVPRRWSEASLLLGSSPLQLLFNTTIPAAMPGICTGLQIGLARAWMVIAAAEMLPGSEAGIGYLVQYAFSLAEMQILVAGMIIAGITGASLHFSLKLLSYPLTFWQNRGHE